MTPEEKIISLEEQLAGLQNDISILMSWMRDRQEQQISLPLDPASKAVLGVAVVEGLGSISLTQSVAVGSTPTNITVPRAYSDTILLTGDDGTVYEIPILQTL